MKFSTTALQQLMVVMARKIRKDPVEKSVFPVCLKSIDQENRIFIHTCGKMRHSGHAKIGN